jgi:hypothetical protein
MKSLLSLLDGILDTIYMIAWAVRWPLVGAAAVAFVLGHYMIGIILAVAALFFVGLFSALSSEDDVG